MKRMDEWLEKYFQINENLLTKLTTDSGRYSDEKLASIEATLNLRQDMLEEVAGFELNDEDRQAYADRSAALKSLEAHIEEAVKVMMAEINGEQAALQDQRKELNRVQKANRSYIGVVQSSEGYFIDKKK